DHGPPVVVGHAGKQPVARQACVVHEDVDVAGFLDESRRRFGLRDVGLDGAAADLRCERLRLLCARAIADDDGRACARELRRDCAPDPARRSGNERRPAFQRGEAHVSASDSCSLSSAARLLTEIAFALRSIRFTRPESTFPGPTSTNVFTPPRISSDAAWVKRTGAVSWSTRSGAMRCADSRRAVTVDMNGATGSWNFTRSIAGRSRSAARATSGEWNAPLTLSFTTRRAPCSCARSMHSSTASCSPDTTIWPGQL